jgi:hypothetical protein
MGEGVRRPSPRALVRVAGPDGAPQGAAGEADVGEEVSAW